MMNFIIYNFVKMKVYFKKYIYWDKFILNLPKEKEKL